MRDSWIGKPTTATVKSGMFKYVDSPADPFIERMDEERKPYFRAGLATLGLRHDPGCIEAHLELADCLIDHDARLRHLNKAIETGQYLWNPIREAEGDQFGWWFINATRPYLRAIKALGLFRLEDGDTDGARECFDLLLEMNPNDNQGIRYLMADLEASPPRM
jgi:tetratricopeptide (TPR) repeat protein